MSGIFQVIFYQPLFNLLIFLYNIVPHHDLGVAIILLTILIKLILLPLSKKSLKSQKALQELQPKLDEIKKQFADKKEELAKATMELYKQNKVNPFSSCLPLLVQLPFLLAVFRVFRDGLKGASMQMLYPFISRPTVINTISFGFLDLSKRSIVLAVLAGAAQYWQSRMMVTKRPKSHIKAAQDEDMMAIMNKQMLIMMPILTVFISLSFPAGLSLYWFVTTLLTGLQQLYIFKNEEIKKLEKIIEGEILK
jgi:YidC/Oxa1 family membrane protein insertase